MTNGIYLNGLIDIPSVKTSFCKLFYRNVILINKALPRRGILFVEKMFQRISEAPSG